MNKYKHDSLQLLAKENQFLKAQLQIALQNIENLQNALNKKRGNIQNNNCQNNTNIGRHLQIQIDELKQENNCLRLQIQNRINKDLNQSPKTDGNYSLILMESKDITQNNENNEQKIITQSIETQTTNEYPIGITQFQELESEIFDNLKLENTNNNNNIQQEEIVISQQIFQNNQCVWLQDQLDRQIEQTHKYKKKYKQLKTLKCKKVDVESHSTECLLLIEGQSGDEELFNVLNLAQKQIDKINKTLF